ncbi:hypothetical protein BLOT_008256 [Blomia tropicalis]|nr:hypothetical protein BLOT_008256 [Blomia tropicalis]
MASLIYEICSIFLLIVLISSPNQSQAQQQQLLQYETYNWIEISNGNWPKKDSKNSDFYFFHGNGDDPLKAFKSDIIPDWSRLIKGVEFDLEYWVNKENNLFRSSLQSILPLADDINLKKEVWEKAHFHDINEQAWNRYKYLSGHDPYTVAFRNAKLAYMEKVPIINSYVEENEFLNIYENKKSQQLNQYKSVSENIFYSYEKNIDFEVKLKNEKDKIKQIQLQLEYENHTTTLVEESYVMINTLIDLNSLTNCSSNLDTTYFHVKCVGKPNNVHIIITNKTSLTEINPIIISNVKSLDENEIEMDSTITSNCQVKTNQCFQSKHESYKPTDISFFRFIDKVEQTDVCYTIKRPTDVDQMDVYFHFSPNEEPIYLNTFPSQPKEFCLNTYVALRNIPSFELIFVLNSKKLSKPFTVVLERKLKATNLDVKIMDATSEILSSTWYYTNLNNKYAIKSLKKDGVYACDILANCFPYEKTKNELYELHDKYSQLLSQSPFFRIRGLSSNDPKLTFEVDPISIQTKNLNEFLKHQFFIADMIDTNQPENHDTKYNLKLKKTKDYIIRIPLDVIDQRVYQLKVEIEPNLNINLTHVTIDGSQNNLKQYLLSEPLNKNTSKMLSFFTEDLFFVDKSQIDPPTGKYIEISFKNLKEDSSLSLDVILKTRRPELDAKVNDDRSKTPKNVIMYKNEKILSNTTKSLFFLSEIIRSPSKQALFPSKIEFDFNSNMNISKNDLSIIELVISQGTIQTFNVSSRLETISNTSLQFKDEAIQTNPDLRRLAGDAYRLGYWITLNNDKLTDAINVELKSFTITFTETNLDQIDIKPTVATDPELMFSRVCPLNFDCDYKDDQLKFIYKQKTVECDTQHQCNNIFEPLLYSSNYYLNDETIVRYSPTVRDSNVQNYLKVKRIISFNEKEDFCIRFDYESTKRPLMVSAHSPTESNELYSIEFATNELNKIGRKVCASWLAPDHTKIDAFYFQFLKADIDDITKHYVSNVKLLPTNTKPTNVLDAIEFNEGNIELFKNNFIDYEEIEFDKDNTILIKLDKLNENKLQTKFIRSKWIQGLKNGENSIHIQVSVEGQNAINSSFYTAKLIVSSPDKIEILTKDLPLSDKKSMNSIELSQHVDWYQITIRLDFDFTLLKKHLDYFELKLSNIIVNDPCMEKEAKNKCENGGKCTRHYGNYSSTCDCGVMELYYGKKCELENFCKRPSPINGRTNENSYCRNMNCHNNQEIKMFECDCPNGNTWNYQRCLPNKLICGVNERPIINSDGADYGCQCMNGLVKIDGQCQTYDVCNSTHRKLLKQPPACHDKHAQCQTNGDDYSCHCSDKFFNQFGRIDADAECIPKECENCEFGCKSDWETNTWKCYCPAGYTFLDNENECIPNNEIIALAQKLKCPITNKSTPETPRPFIVDKNCRCTDGYKLDENKTCHIDLGYYTQKLNCGHLGAEIKQDDVDLDVSV